MRQIEYNIDINKSSYNYKACMQNDDLEIKVNVYNNSLAYDLANSTVNLNWVMPDGTPLTKNNLEKENNVIIIKLDKKFTETKGKAKFELEIINNGKMTTFPLEIVIVQKSFQSEIVNNKIVELLDIIKMDEHIDEFLDNIKQKQAELSSQIAEFENEVNTIVANVTNGNESATNSEVVLARQGNISLGINLSKMKESIKKALSSIFIEEIRTAKNTDFIGEGTGTVNINNNILSVTGETNQYSYIACDSDALEFTLEDTKYILLGVGSKTFTTLNICTVGKVLGRLMDWTSNSYVVRADNLITKSFSQGDKVRVEKIEEGYKIYQNGNLVLELNKSNYSSVTGWENSKLGFFLVKDKGSNLASNIKILDYNLVIQQK